MIKMKSIKELENEGRAGVFRIQTSMLTGDPKILFYLFSKIFIIKAEYLYHAASVEYVGYSEFFKPCPKQATPPIYEFVVIKNEDIDIVAPGSYQIVIIKEEIDDNFSLEEIKKAFYNQFHMSGEEFFNYLGDRDDNISSTESTWQDFEDDLKAIKEIPDITLEEIISSKERENESK